MLGISKLSRRLGVRNRLRTEVSYGKNDPVFNIGRHVVGNPFYPMMEDPLIDMMMEAEDKGFFKDNEGVEASKLLDMLSGSGMDDMDFMQILHEMYQRSATTPEERKKKKMKWYRLASKLVDNIPQFVSQFRIPQQLERDKDGTPVQQMWEFQSPVNILERYFLDDPDLPQLVDLHIRERMKSTDKRSVETLILDISGSMYGDNTTMALLYIFNRIQHCRQGHLVLQMVTFDTSTHRVAYRYPNGKSTYIFDTERMTDEDFDRLEEQMYSAARPSGGTHLMQALHYVNSKEMAFYHANGKPMRNTMPTFTIITDEGSSVDQGYTLRNTRFNSLLAYHNPDLVQLAKRTGGYHNTLSNLLKKIQGK